MRRLFLYFAASLSLAASDYQLGNGYDLSESLRIGGYISAEYKQNRELDEFEIDDIAVMGYGNLTHNFSYLAEFEAVKYFAKDFKSDTEEYNREFYIERAYVNYKLNNSAELTAGKFITPGSYWNQVPINVLRDLTSKPSLAQNIFPRLVTGIGAEGYMPGSDSFKYALFYQNNEDLDHGYNNFYTDQQAGAMLSREFDDAEIALWGGHFHVGEGDSIGSDYIGATFRMEKADTKVLVELAQSTIEYEYLNIEERKNAFYVQASRQVARKHYLAARYETYESTAEAVDEEIAIIGYNYRPIFPVSLKAEYQFHDESEKDMALFSLSILF